MAQSEETKSGFKSQTFSPELDALIAQSRWVTVWAALDKHRADYCAMRDDPKEEPHAKRAAQDVLDVLSVLCGVLQDVTRAEVLG